jgi:hypothetical protein
MRNVHNIPLFRTHFRTMFSVHPGPKERERSREYVEVAIVTNVPMIVDVSVKMILESQSQ